MGLGLPPTLKQGFKILGVSTLGVYDSGLALIPGIGFCKSLQGFIQGAGTLTTATALDSGSVLPAYRGLGLVFLGFRMFTVQGLSLGDRGYGRGLSPLLQYPVCQRGS